MEWLINFMQQYWGVSVVGGVTVGGIITFAIVQIKYYRKDAKKNALIDTAVAAVEKSIAVNHASDLEKAQLQAENIYLKKTMTLLFKSTSFLISASKIPTEDKLVLEADFIELKDESIVLAKTLAIDVVEDIVEGGVQKAIDENATPIIVAAVAVADKVVNLIGKYTDRGE